MIAEFGNMDGPPLKIPPGVKDVVVKRFLRRISITSGCWKWTGAKTAHGYGHMRNGYSMISAHRLSYRVFKGEVPRGLFVLHSCDVRDCVNPDHLRAGTHQENMDEKKARNPDCCRNPKYKFPIGSESFGARLTETDIPKILKMRNEGMGYLQIAKKYGVVRETIRNVAMRKTWRHVS